MQFKKNSFLKKALGVLRFFTCRLYYHDVLTTSGLSLVGKSCRIYFDQGAKVRFLGRVILADEVEIQSSGRLEIGSGCTVNRYSRIVCYENILLGNNVVIAQFVTILDHDHKYKVEGQNIYFDEYSTAPIKIGSNVWIGDKATILKGCTIGDSVIIAAHTLVNKDVPSNCIVAGVPFRVIRHI